jgi:hypothetical protein
MLHHDPWAYGFLTKKHITEGATVCQDWTATRALDKRRTVTDVSHATTGEGQNLSLTFVTRACPVLRYEACIFPPACLLPYPKGGSHR